MWRHNVLNKKPRRGRPKGTGKVKPKSLPELMDEALLRPSLSAVYTSTTQGGMKIVYDGHHFKFIFRKGPNSIFQCCWNENNEQCKVRALVNQKRVYHLDGKHTHYGRAVDKSSTSIVTIDSPSLDTTVLSQTKDIANKNETPKAKYEDHKIVLLNAIPQTKNDNESDDFMAPEDFKERIKKRLQKALLGKKKGIAFQSILI